MVIEHWQDRQFRHLRYTMVHRLASSANDNTTQWQLLDLRCMWV